MTPTEPQDNIDDGTHYTWVEPTCSTGDTGEDMSADRPHRYWVSINGVKTEVPERRQHLPPTTPAKGRTVSHCVEGDCTNTATVGGCCPPTDHFHCPRDTTLGGGLEGGGSDSIGGLPQGYYIQEGRGCVDTKEE